MLGKLLKYEFKATGRMMLPFMGALVALSAVAWVVLNGVFSMRSGFVNMVGGIIVTLYVLSLIAICIVTLVLLIYRFYRSFLSDEGYLTFTLPAGVNSHLGAKLICSAVWIVLTAVLVVLSLLLTTSSFGEFIRLPWGMMFERIYAETGIAAGSVIGYILEVLLMLLLGALCSCLMFYTAMSLGYGFSRHKVLYSVLIFIGIGILTQIISVAVLANAAIFFDTHQVMFYRGFDPESFAHGALLSICAAELIYGGILYLVTALSLKRRLNLP